MFPYLPGQRPVRMRRLELWFEARGCDGAQNHALQFVPERDGCGADSEECCVRYLVTCVASADYPCLYHGVLDFPFPWLHDECQVKIGDFLFPHQAGTVLRAYMVCSYEAGQAERCLAPAAPCPDACRTSC